MSGIHIETLPSRAVTGSAMTTCVMGHTNARAVASAASITSARSSV
jgi:hypothetical protein